MLNVDNVPKSNYNIIASLHSQGIGLGPRPLAPWPPGPATKAACHGTMKRRMEHGTSSVPCLQNVVPTLVYNSRIM